jgi:hypothetical protein
MEGKRVIKHFQVPMEEEKMEQLKKATGKETVKEALTEAVEFYLRRKK